jgi:hypothetical protein
MAESWVVNNKDKLAFFVAHVKEQYENGRHLTYSIKDETRTDRQNGALHMWFRQIAQELNDCGQWARHPFSDTLEIPFTDILIKEMLYKPIIQKMYDKTSTGNLSVRELSEAAEVLIRWLSEHKNVYVPFPQILKDKMK